MSTSPAGRHGALTLLTRAECGLCEEMLAELRALGARATLPPLCLVDVDSDPQLQRRYGLRVPVLLLDGDVICSHRLDAEELLRMLRRP
ncbi:MAG TPA: glutaredoxin family protein [Steroidobacteraceae bacterium]